MYNINIDIPEEEITRIIKSIYYRHDKVVIENQIKEVLIYEVRKYLQEDISKEEFNKLLKEALIEALARYKLRDIEDIKKLLNIREG